METLSNLAKCAAGVYHIAFKEISNHTSRDEKLQSHCNQSGKQHLNALGQTLAGKNTAAAPLSFAKQLQEHMEAPRQMPVIIAPSVDEADTLHLGIQMEAAVKGGVDLHVGCA